MTSTRVIPPRFGDADDRICGVIFRTCRDECDLAEPGHDLTASPGISSTFCRLACFGSVTALSKARVLLLMPVETFRVAPLLTR
jgi:hypothetical protein